MDALQTQALTRCDAAVTPLWLAANGLVFYSARALSIRLFNDATALQVALRTVLIYVATAVGGATFLGACGLLDARRLMAVAVAASIAGLVLARRIGRDRAGSDARELGRTPGGEGREQKANWCIRGAWLLLGGFLLGHIVVNGLLAFQNEFDGLAYHIPLIDHWLQARSLYAPDGSHWWSPGNAELVGLWIVAPFSGDFLISLGNLPFLVLWVLSGLDAARLIGLAVVWRHLAVFGMIAVHATFRESEKAMNDVAVVACFFASIAYVFRYFESQQVPDLVTAAAATGLLAGVKYFALGYAALVVAVMLVGGALAMGRRSALKTIALFLPIAALFGGYWYLRNFLATGAPLYPQGGDAFGIGYPRLSDTTLAFNRSPEVPRLAREALWAMAGPCHTIAVAGAPAAAVLLFGAGCARLRRGAPSEAAVLWGTCSLLIGTFVVLLVTPFCVEDQPGTLNHLRWSYTPARYGLCFLGMAMVAVVWAFQCFFGTAISLRNPFARMRRRCRRCGALCAQGFFTLAVVWQLGMRIAHMRHRIGVEPGADVATAVLVGLNAVYGWLLLGVNQRELPYRRSLIAALGGVALIASSVCIGLLSRRWHNGFAAHYDELRSTGVFSHLATRSSRTIAVLDRRAYPFFGSARQHRVLSPVVLSSYDGLVKYLEDRRPDVVASLRRDNGLAFDRYKHAPEWLMTHEVLFHPIMTSGEFVLYSFHDRACHGE